MKLPDDRLWHEADLELLLLLAIELEPEAGGARRYCEALLGRGIPAKDTRSQTIRIAPPLVIKREQIDWALANRRELRGHRSVSAPSSNNRCSGKCEV